MKDIKTTEEFRVSQTSIEPCYYTDNSSCKGMYDGGSVESLMQEYAEYYHKAEVEEKANIIIEKIKEIQIIEHDNYDKGRNAGLNDAIHIIHMEVLT